jgi:hypothetical protein
MEYELGVRLDNIEKLLSLVAEKVGVFEEMKKEGKTKE